MLSQRTGLQSPHIPSSRDFTRWLGLLWLGLLWLATALPALAQVQCNSAIDQLTQARERARPGLTRDALEHSNELLKMAVRRCPDLGDAWYYRALYARELKDQVDANYAMQKAEYFNSEALRRGYNPFAPVVVAKAEAEIKLPPVREKYALVVGISQFQDRNIKALQYPAKDAQDFAALLRDPNYGRFKTEHVRVLTNEQATTRNIKQQIENLAAQARPEDLVVLFFSTHGSDRDGKKTDLNYLVTYDTEVASLYATSLPMVSIVDDVSKLIKAQRMVIVLDSCFSGAAGFAGGLETTSMTSVTSSAPPSAIAQTNAGSKQLDLELTTTAQPNQTELLNRISQNAGRVVITASQPNELSWESEQLRNGFFTYYLIQALKQKQGLAPLDEVYAAVRDQVTRSVQAERSQPQHPTLRSNTRGGKLDICIGVAPQPR